VSRHGINTAPRWLTMLWWLGMHFVRHTQLDCKYWTLKKHNTEEQELKNDMASISEGCLTLRKLDKRY
jgi:hypothetical protein